MLVALNGRLVPEDQAVVSVFDRSFLYGDGLFETMRVFHGHPFRWDQHLDRLARGTHFLKIRLPLSPAAFLNAARQLIEQNQMPDALLRLTLSRGVGVRGYSPNGADAPFWVMSLHPAPAQSPDAPPAWSLVSSGFRLPAGEALAQFKTCNKLPQIMASAEADATGAHEALLLNTDGHVVEAASSNLFWIENGTLRTPSLASGILAGVTREVVAELATHLGVKVEEAHITPEALCKVEGIFVSLSSFGIAEAVSMDGRAVRQSPLTRKLYQEYWRLLVRETGD
jgi:aminodeoxychorismate lyase